MMGARAAAGENSSSSFAAFPPANTTRSANASMRAVSFLLLVGTAAATGSSFFPSNAAAPVRARLHRSGSGGLEYIPLGDPALDPNGNAAGEFELLDGGATSGDESQREEGAPAPQRGPNARGRSDSYVSSGRDGSPDSSGAGSGPPTPRAGRSAAAAGSRARTREYLDKWCV